MVAEIQRTRRVMVLDLSWRHTGYVAAALHAAGIETLLVSTGWPDRIGLGRYCRQVQSPAYTSAAYVPFVREQISRFKPDWVIPLCEPLFELLWKLDPPCPAPLYPPTEAWQRQIVLDRRRLYDCAAAAGIPIPPWRPLAGDSDVDDAIGRFGLPLVIRGTAGFSGGQVRIVHSAAQARSAFAQMQRVSPRPPFAQSFIHGERLLMGGVFSRGEMLCAFAQEVIESHPPSIGPSIRVRTLREPRLEAHTRALLRALRWSGMASVDFIRDAGGVPVLMELNPRPWGSIVVAERSGVPLCRTFAQLLTGEPMTAPPPYKAGVECIVPEAFVLARRQTGILSTLRALEARELWACVSGLPWSQPRLALHVMRRVCQGLRSGV